MAKVFIDPGHGFSDSGAVANGLIEKDINLFVAQKLAKLLKHNGFEVKLSRESDVFVPLETRSQMANDWGAQIFISIHHNAGGGDGFEIIHSISTGKDDRLARLIGEEFDKFQNKRRIFTRANSQNKDYYAVLRNTKCEAKVITEYCFLDSKDSEIIDTAAEQSREAYLIAFAICRYVGIKFRDIGV